MKKVVINYIKSSLRRVWGRSRQRQAALKNAKVSYGHYRCAECKEIFRRKYINVDHIVAIGKFVDFNIYIERLFVEPCGLRILCLQCHKAKTRSDKKSFSNK